MGGKNINVCSFFIHSQYYTRVLLYKLSFGIQCQDNLGLHLHNLIC